MSKKRLQYFPYNKPHPLPRTPRHRERLHWRRQHRHLCSRSDRTPRAATVGRVGPSMRHATAMATTSRRRPVNHPMQLPASAPLRRLDRAPTSPVGWVCREGQIWKLIGPRAPEGLD